VSKKGGNAMTEELYLEKLNWFKENEKPEVVLFVTDYEPRTRIIIAWTNTKTSMLRNISPLKTNVESEIWDWLWQNTAFSLDELRLKSAVSSLDINGLVRPIIANRIIYPDGSVNSFVQRYLRERVLALFESKPKRATAKTKK
jgi:hypothetical protein